MKKPLLPLLLFLSPCSLFCHPPQEAAASKEVLVKEQRYRWISFAKGVATTLSLGGLLFLSKKIYFSLLTNEEKIAWYAKEIKSIQAKKFSKEVTTRQEPIDSDSNS